MAYERKIIGDQNNKTARKHQIVDLDVTPRVIETKAVTLEKIRLDGTKATLANTKTWLKIWNGVPSSVNTVAPDFQCPVDTTNIESHEFNIVGVFTAGMTIIATSTKANGNAGAAITQVDPQAAGPADDAIDVQITTKLES